MNDVPVLFKWVQMESQLRANVLNFNAHHSVVLSLVAALIGLQLIA